MPDEMLDDVLVHNTFITLRQDLPCVPAAPRSWSCPASFRTAETQRRAIPWASSRSKKGAHPNLHKDAHKEPHQAARKDHPAVPVASPSRARTPSPSAISYRSSALEFPGGRALPWAARRAPAKIQTARTTLLIRNLPIRAKVQQIFGHLDELGFGGQYDYVHFPLDPQSRMHRGYAFVNFTTPQECARCKETIVGTQLRDSCSPKRIEVEAAGLQGVVANIAALPLSHGRHEKHLRPAHAITWICKDGEMKPYRRPT